MLIGIITFSYTILIALSIPISFWYLVLVIAIYNILIMLDSGALTAGTVAASKDDERGQREVVDPTSLIDVELNYRLSDNLTVVFGANNATNAFPTQIETRRSQGMPYPRRTPIGYHGGMMFTRLTYNF